MLAFQAACSMCDGRGSVCLTRVLALRLQGLASSSALCTLPECLSRLSDICHRLLDVQLAAVPLAAGQHSLADLGSNLTTRYCKKQHRTIQSRCSSRCSVEVLVGWQRNSCRVLQARLGRAICRSWRWWAAAVRFWATCTLTCTPGATWTDSQKTMCLSAL